jgi:hypothetical protein
MVSDGWLLNEEQNQILLTIQGEALKFYKSKHVREKYLVKVLPTDLRHHDVSVADNKCLINAQHVLGLARPRFGRIGRKLGRASANVAFIFSSSNCRKDLNSLLNGLQNI